MVKSQINEGGKEGEKFTDHLEMKETLLENGLVAQWWSKRQRRECVGFHWDIVTWHNYLWLLEAFTEVRFKDSIDIEHKFCQKSQTQK